MEEEEASPPVSRVGLLTCRQQDLLLEEEEASPPVSRVGLLTCRQQDLLLEEEEASPPVSRVGRRPESSPGWRSTSPCNGQIHSAVRRSHS